MAELFRKPLLSYKKGYNTFDVNELRMIRFEKAVMGNRDTTKVKVEVPPDDGELGAEFTFDQNIRRFELAIQICSYENKEIYTKFS